MIVRWPGRIAAGSTSGLPWAFHDFLLTAVKLAGRELPANTDGISVVPTLFGQGAQHFLLVGQHVRRKDAVRAVEVCKPGRRQDRLPIEVARRPHLARWAIQWVHKFH